MKRCPISIAIGLMLSLLLGLPMIGQAEEVFVRIVLDKPVHFSAPDGTDVPVQAGEFVIVSADTVLTLFQVGKEEPIVIGVRASTHDENVETPTVLSAPEESPDEDTHHLVVLLPGGKSFDAVGTYSGIKPRGLKDRMARSKLVKRLIQAGNASFKKPAAARLEESQRVPPTQFLIGSDNHFSDASGFRRLVCSWVGGHLIPQDDFGCQSYIDLNNGTIQVKADRYGTGFRMGNGKSEAWVEMYKDFTVPPQSRSGQEQAKTAVFNVPIEYHGKMASTHPLMASHYKLFLILTEVSFDAGPTRNVIVLEQRQLEEETVRAFIKVVKGIPIPIPDVQVDLTTQRNPVYFSAPVIPGRIYRLTIRVEVDAGGALGVQPPSGYGSAVNFMDKAMIISEGQRVDGYIKWGNVKVRINP